MQEVSGPNGQPPQEDEAQLVERAKREPSAFSELYERHVDRIYAYIYYRTGDARESEDLTARVFYRALAHLPEFTQTGAPFIAWLYRIAHNLVANWHRDKMRHPELPLDLWGPPLPGDVAPHSEAERAEAERNLLDAIRALPDDRQQLLLLKFVDGLSNIEIGRILGRSEGAIKSLYHRTLHSLRQELEKRGIKEAYQTLLAEADMDWVLVLLRIVHIFAGVFWLGATWMLVFYLEPTATALGGDGGKFLGYMNTVRRFPITISAAAMLTALAGLILYYRDFGVFDISSPGGLIFTLGGIAGLIGAGIGFFAVRPTSAELTALGQSVASAGKPPSTEQIARMRELQGALRSWGRWTGAVVGLALLAMVVGGIYI